MNKRKLERLFKKIYKDFKGWEIEISISKRKDNPEMLDNINIDIQWPKK